MERGRNHCARFDARFRLSPAAGGAAWTACRPFVVSTCTARVERPLVLINSIGGRTSLTFTRWNSIQCCTATDRIVSPGVVRLALVAAMPAGPVWSGVRDRRADLGGVAGWGRRGFQGHAAGALDRRLVGLLEQEGAPTKRVTAASSGKMPAASVRRLISRSGRDGDQKTAEGP